jgi:hypothetical protein
MGFDLTGAAVLSLCFGIAVARGYSADKNRNTMKGQRILFLVFSVISAAASSIPESVGGYVSYLLGIAISMIAAIGIKVSRKHELLWAT